MPIEIDLIRHGESILNAVGIYQGARSDSSLSETGIKQAEDLAQKLAGRKYHGVYSSPLKRAFQTAQIINRRQPKLLPIHQETFLTEIDHKDISGMLIDEIPKVFPEEWQQWLKNPLRTRPYFSSDQPLHQEADNAFGQLKTLVSLWNDGERLLVVSHGGKMRLIILKILNCLHSFHSLVIPNCGRITLRFEEILKSSTLGAEKIYKIRVALF